MSASAAIHPRSLALASAMSAALLCSAAPVQANSTSSHTCVDCPQRVPDAGGLAAPAALVEATLQVTGGTCEGDVALGGAEVAVNVLHSHIGDLRLRLRSPSGTFYTLVDRPADASGAAGSCAGDDLLLGFTEGNGEPALRCDERIPSGGVATEPVTAMTALVGPIETGTWTLEVGDFADGGDGLLRDWSMHFYCLPQPLMLRSGFED